MGSVKIIWTEKAEEQLNQIFNYIALDSTLYAYRTANKIIESAELIAENPRIGRTVPEFDKDDLREILFKNYRIIYQLKKNEIHIVSVIHGARLLPKEL